MAATNDEFVDLAQQFLEISRGDTCVSFFCAHSKPTDFLLVSVFNTYISVSLSLVFCLYPRRLSWLISDPVFYSTYSCYLSIVIYSLLSSLHITTFREAWSKGLPVALPCFSLTITRPLSFSFVLFHVQ